MRPHACSTLFPYTTLFRSQSAIEYAALLHEAGAAVQVVSRRPINWLGPDRWNRRSVLERILAPDASIAPGWDNWIRSEEHTSELQSHSDLVCRLLLEKKKK